MTVIIDYGVGNLFSLKSSLAFIGTDAVVSGDPDTISRADRVILPGVGAFGDAAEKLSATGLDKLVLELAGSGKPLLGICVGMQLLFDRSYEYGVHDGLSLISGDVGSIESIIPKGYKVPHIGWNSLVISETGRKSPLLKYVSDGAFVYFVHSYAASAFSENVLANVEYGAHLPAVVGKDNVFGTQFHPEKSGEVGLGILKAFCEHKY